MTTETRCSHCGGDGAHYLHCPFVGCEIPLIDLHPSKTLENLLDDLCWAVERVNKAAHWGQRDQIPEEKKEIQRIRGEILTRAAAWEKAAIARPEIEGAKDLAFELGADICSDLCDTDPCEPEEMAHCSWCDQASRLYRMLRDASEATVREPAEAASAVAEQDSGPSPQQGNPQVTPTPPSTPLVPAHLHGAFRQVGEYLQGVLYPGKARK